MKRPLLLAAALGLAFLLPSCKTKDSYATGMDGDFVDGVPLPERTDGSSYLGGGVSKGQFSPVQFLKVKVINCLSFISLCLHAGRFGQRIKP
jgi:hypothetical protein